MLTLMDGCFTGTCEFVARAIINSLWRLQVVMEPFHLALKQTICGDIVFNIISVHNEEV